MSIAQYIDHTLLKPDATEEQIMQLCDEAERYGFATVCVNPAWVALCAHRLKDVLAVGICTVVGFPLGATLPSVKAHEAKLAVAAGALEVDMVVNIGALKSGHLGAVEADIRAVRDVIPLSTLKVIIEAGLLTQEEKRWACLTAQAAGADFVKTSTGFSVGGATVEDVRFMRKAVTPRMGVKAAGGIKTYGQARAMLQAGATRLGCSASVAIVLEERPDLRC